MAAKVCTRHVSISSYLYAPSLYIVAITLLFRCLSIYLSINSRSSRFGAQQKSLSLFLFIHSILAYSSHHLFFVCPSCYLKTFLDHLLRFGISQKSTVASKRTLLARLFQSSFSLPSLSSSTTLLILSSITAGRSLTHITSVFLTFFATLHISSLDDGELA